MTTDDNRLTTFQLTVKENHGLGMVSLAAGYNHKIDFIRDVIKEGKEKYKLP
jgi:hypothetical protein